MIHYEKPRLYQLVFAYHLYNVFYLLNTNSKIDHSLKMADLAVVMAIWAAVPQWLRLLPAQPAVHLARRRLFAAGRGARAEDGRLVVCTDDGPAGQS